MFSARYIGKSCSNIFANLCIFVAELKTRLTIKGGNVVERRFSSFLNCHVVAKSFLPVELQSANPMTRFHWHWHTDIVSRYDNLRKPRFVLRSCANLLERIERRLLNRNTPSQRHTLSAVIPINFQPSRTRYFSFLVYPLQAHEYNTFDYCSAKRSHKQTVEGNTSSANRLAWIINCTIDKIDRSRLRQFSRKHASCECHMALDRILTSKRWRIILPGISRISAKQPFGSIYAMAVVC